MRLVKLIGCEPIKEHFSNILVGNDGISRHDARNIKGFCGRLERDADGRSLIAYRRKRRVLMTKEGHVGMDFVAHHQQMVVETEVGQALKCFFCPHQSAGIMGVAEQEHTAFVIAHLRQVVEIDVIIAIFSLAKGVPNHLTMVALWR